MFQPVFSVVCIDECLEPFLGCFQDVNETIKNTTLFTTRARAEDDTFCQVKFLQSPITRLFQNCTIAWYMQLSLSAVFSWPENQSPSSPSYHYYKNYLANCSVPVGTTCNSASALAGAAIVYLNVVVAIAAFLMTTTIAWVDMSGNTYMHEVWTKPFSR